jgi:hypothetical protein
MRARNVLVAPVITGKKAAELFLGKRISAAPVVDGEQRPIVSACDLLHRVEAGTDAERDGQCGRREPLRHCGNPRRCGRPSRLPPNPPWEYPRQTTI